MSWDTHCIGDWDMSSEDSDWEIMNMPVEWIVAIKSFDWIIDNMGQQWADKNVTIHSLYRHTYPSRL